MGEGKKELSLPEQAEMFKQRVSFHKKKASWKRLYREKFNDLVKEHTAKVDVLKAKRNKCNQDAKDIKKTRDECTDYYRRAKLNNNITIMNTMLREQDISHTKMIVATEEGNRYHGLVKVESEEVLRLIKKADKCHKKMVKSKTKADEYFQEYIMVMKLIAGGEEE